MRYYPVYLNLKGRGVLIVGAGDVARQKIHALLESEARIRVVAPEAVPEIQQLAKSHRLEWIRRSYRHTDLHAVSLVIAATDDPRLQKRVAAQARKRRIWINVVDVTPLCDFIAPAIVTRGNVQIAISTGGASPALAKLIRQTLEPLIGPEYGALAQLLQRYRPKILKLPKTRRESLWEAIISPSFLDRMKREGAAPLETYLKELIKDKTNGKSVI